MASRLTQIPELKEKNNDLNSMWRLFDSCQGHPSSNLISEKMHLDKHITDLPRKLGNFASFDEECQRVQNETDLQSAAVAAVHQHKAKQLVKRQLRTKMDGEFAGHPVEAHKRARKSKRYAYQPSSYNLSNAGGLTHRQATTSAEISLNELTLAATLGVLCARDRDRDHQGDSIISECLQRSVHLVKYDEIEKINMHPFHMKAKSFDDGRKFVCKEGESKSSSDQLKVLTSTKEFMGLLEEPNPLRARRIKNLHHPVTEEVTIQSVLAAKFLGHDGLYPRSSGKPGGTLASQKGKANKSSDKIVILKPVQQNGNYPKQVTCHCSSMPSNTLSKRVSDMKLGPFSFREMKKKLKHTFRGTIKESGLFSVHDTVEAPPQSSSTKITGDCCTSRGSSIMDSCDSSINAIRKDSGCKQKVLKLKQGSYASSLTRAVNSNVEFSGVGLSKNQEYDIILEAKRHLSLRLRDILAEETLHGKKSPKSLRRILYSPERPFCPLSPRKGSQSYSSGSSEMRYSHCNFSTRVPDTISKEEYGKEMARPNALGPNTKVTSCVDCNKCGGRDEIPKASSLVPKTDETLRDTDASVGENADTQDDCDIVNLQPESQNFEASSSPNSRNTTRIMQVTGTTKLESPMHSILDALSRNEESMSTTDYIPSTPFSNHQLDLPEGIKHQKEHCSPISVLEPFFMEDGNSPPSISPEKGPLATEVRLQPLRLDFEECSSESSSKNQPIIAKLCTEEHVHLSHYVHLVLQASGLNWDKLSEIKSLPEELLHDSLFYGVDYLPDECYFDPKLLFDHINEALIEIYQSHFSSPPHPAFLKPKIISSPLAEAVINEIMKEADFYLLPQTEKRTLDQLVSKDVENCRSWLDIRLDTEMTVVDISEEVLEKSVLDVLLDFLT